MKEEAKRIIEMYSNAIKSKCVVSNPVKFGAKQCALNHVNGIIEEFHNTHNYESRLKYWYSVKQEIENI